jgi:hypothetical protein
MSPDGSRMIVTGWRLVGTNTHHGVLIVIDPSLSVPVVLNYMLSNVATTSYYPAYAKPEFFNNTHFFVQTQ